MNNERIDLLESKPVNSSILKLAIPMMLAMAVQLIYNLTDTYFIGLTGNPLLVAAISLAAPIFMLVQAIGNIFAVGTASYISRKLGEKELDQAKFASSVAIYSSIAIGVVITAVMLVFRQPIVGAIGTSEQTYAPTAAYMNIIVAFAVPFILNIVLAGLVRSEGATKKAMTGMMLGIGINIVLDPILILWLELGVAGAAWATVIGSIVGVVYLLTHFLGKDTLLSSKLSDFRPAWEIYSETFKIGVPSALGMIVMSVSFVLVNILAASYGDHVVAGNGIQMRVASMAFTLMFGLGQGFQPFAGYNYGAKNYNRLLDGFRLTMVYSTLLALFFTVIFTLFGENLIGFFIDDAATVAAGTQILRAFTWAIPFLGVQITMMITFQATGKAVQAMIISLGRQFLIYLPLLFVLNNLYGFNGFIYAQPIADILTTFVAVVMSISFMKELRLLQNEQNALIIEPV